MVVVVEEEASIMAITMATTIHMITSEFTF
jgi:hypothetical protein